MSKIFPLILFLLAALNGSPVHGGEPAGTSIQDVTFISERDSTEQKYVALFPPRYTADKSHDILIALHGHGSDRWQFIRDPRDECRAARDVAAEHGMIFISPDYRASTSWMGPAAETDVVQIIEELRGKYRISKIYICGASMGGAACLTFAVLHPELIDGVASMNGTANFLEYDNFQPAIQESFGSTKEEIPLEYKKRSAEYWPEKLTMPVGLTVSGKDDIVPPQSVLRLAKVLKSVGGNVLPIYREEAEHSTNYADAKAILEYILKQSIQR